MNSKSTWFWGITAAVLFAFIFFFERHIHSVPAGPTKVLPGLNVADVTAVAITPTDRTAIRVERAEHAWQITQPITYLAHSTNVDKFLNALETLTSYPPITPADLRRHSKADEEFGFVTPQATVILFRGQQPLQILFGSRTVPGDQVFLRVVGVENVYIVDSSLLDLLPHTVDDWRDRSFVDLAGLDFDHLTVTNAGNVFELRRDSAKSPWRIIGSTPARADNEKVTALLAQLPALHANQFASDHARTELDSFGLQPPDLELNFSNGTNTVLDLQFGKSPTNDPAQVFARRDGRDTVLTVSNALLTPWRSAFDNLRDRHLLSVGTQIDSIDIRAWDNFTLIHETNEFWKVEPQNFRADSNFMAGLIVCLTTMQVTQFVKDVVAEPDLPGYGLATPVQEWIIQSQGTTTNSTVHLKFGATLGDRVYVKRADEDSVYAVALADLQWLPAASWQMRDRVIWNFNAADVTNIVVHEGARERKIVRSGEHSWGLAPGSQGIINDLAIDELTPRFAGLTAAMWTARAPTNLVQYGFTERRRHLTFELKSGEKYTVEFGGEAPTQFPYAAVNLDGEQWVFEFPWDLYQLMLVYFSIPNALP